MTRRARVRLIVLALVALPLGGCSGKAASLVFPLDDPIYPGGQKRPQADIVRFMEQEVMPWARVALGPIKTGPASVTCLTCHGVDGEERGWQMPGVLRLPRPELRDQGWEVFGGTLDAQIRNAIYGYAASTPEKEKLTGYMRQIVTPGMARLLGRPAFDFTRSYEYNRERLALGCYHCHRVK